MNIKTNKYYKNQKYIVMGLFLIMSIVLFVGKIGYAHKVDANIDRVEDLKERTKVETQEEIAETLIRFHVLANSDSDIDQDIKIKVRDRILEEIAPYLEKSQNLDETRKIIQDKTPNMIEIAERVLQENGFDYNVSASLGQHSFPGKYYGKFTLPGGEYEAFRIILGEGKGSNWWCVMFPPLCFINVEEVEEEVGDLEENPQPGSDTLEDLIEPATNIQTQEEQSLEEPSVLEENQEPVQIRWKFIDAIQSVFSVFK